MENIPFKDKSIQIPSTSSIFLTKGKYGYCIKLMEGDKCKFASIEDTLPENITLKESIFYFTIIHFNIIYKWL